MESNVLGKRMASQAEEDKEDGEGEQPEGQDPAVAGVSARRLGRKRKKTNLTRSERAKIRILYRHEVPCPEISTMLGRCIPTVRNVVFGRGKKMPDDDDDYDYVDSAFATQYPPLPTARESKPHDNVKQESIPNSKSVTRVAKPSSTSAPPDRVARSKRNMYSALIPRPPSQAPANKQRTVGPSGQQSEPIELVSDEDEPSGDSSVPITEFLSGLAHDIAWVHEDLERQDLGTMEKLLAVADWPEEDLHMMFKEALPGITVPQRFILIKGLKKRQAEMV